MLMVIMFILVTVIMFMIIAMIMMVIMFVVRMVATAFVTLVPVSFRLVAGRVQLRGHLVTNEGQIELVKFLLLSCFFGGQATTLLQAGELIYTLEHFIAYHFFTSYIHIAGASRLYYFS